jgi:hypothetical protein
MILARPCAPTAALPENNGRRIATRRAGECYHDAPRLAKAALITWAALSSDRWNWCE